MTLSFLSTSSLLEAVHLDFEQLPSLQILKGKLERKQKFLMEGQYPGRPQQLLAHNSYREGIEMKIRALKTTIAAQKKTLDQTPVKGIKNASRLYESGRTKIEEARTLTNCPKPVVNTRTLPLHERAQLAKKLQIILADHTTYKDPAEDNIIEYIDPLQRERIERIACLLLKQKYTFEGEKDSDDAEICTHQTFLDMLFQTYDLIDGQQAAIDRLRSPISASQSSPAISACEPLLDSQYATLEKLRHRYAAIFLFDRLQRISGERALPFDILVSIGSKDPVHRKEVVEDHPFYNLLSARHQNEVMSYLIGHELSLFPQTLNDRRVVGEAPNLESLKGNVFEVHESSPSGSQVASCSSSLDSSDFIISKPPIESIHTGEIKAAFHRYTVYPNENSLCTTLQIPRAMLLMKIKEEGEKEGKEACEIRNALMAPILARKVSDVTRVDYREPLLEETIHPSDSQFTYHNVSKVDFSSYIDHLLSSREPLPLQFVHAYANATNRTINLWIGSYQSVSRQLILIHNCRNEGEKKPIHLFLNNGQYQRLLALDAPGQEKKRMEVVQQKSFDAWQLSSGSSSIDENSLFLTQDEVGQFSDILEQPNFLLVDSFNPYFETDLGNPLPRGYKCELDPSQIHRKWGFRGIDQGEEPGEIVLTGDGFVYYYDLTKEEMAPFHGKSFSFEVEVWSNVKGAYCQFWDYPNLFKTISDTHSGNSSWEKLALNFAVDSSQNRFLFYPIIVPSAKGEEMPIVRVKGVNLREIDGVRSSIPMFPCTFNYSFIMERPGGPIQGYSLVKDPEQEHKKRYGPIDASRRETGHARIEGDGYVFYHPLDPTSLFGQKFRFTAAILSNVPGAHIQYWGYPGPKIQSKSYSSMGEWETLAIEFTISPGKKIYYLYPAILPGTKEVTDTDEVPFVEVKDLKLIPCSSTE